MVYSVHHPYRFTVPWYLQKGVSHEINVHSFPTFYYYFMFNFFYLDVYCLNGFLRLLLPGPHEETMFE